MKNKKIFMKLYVASFLIKWTHTSIEQCKIEVIMFSLAFVIVNIDVCSFANVWRLIFDPNYAFLYIVMSSLSSKL